MELACKNTKEINTSYNKPKFAKMARISKSIWGNSYCAEQLIGGTLYYSHFDTYEEAVQYCQKNNLKIVERFR